MGYRHITNAGNLGNFCEELAVVLQLVVRPELPPKELRKMSMRPCTTCQWVKRFSAYVTWTENNGIIIWRPVWKSLTLLNHSSNKFLATPWVQAIPCNRVTLVNLKIENWSQEVLAVLSQLDPNDRPNIADGKNGGVADDWGWDAYGMNQ